MTEDIDATIAALGQMTFCTGGALLLQIISLRELLIEERERRIRELTAVGVKSG